MNAQSTISLHTGNTMPVIGVGTWLLTQDTPGTIVEALRLGYRMIDTSGDYGTQPGIGEALRRTDIPRDDIYIVTKVEEDEDTYAATRKNLSELGLDYANLILIHRPPPAGAGEGLWEGLIRAKEEGLTRDIGISNYPLPLMQQLVRSTGEVPVVNQVEWSPFGHSMQVLDYCREHGIVVQAYSPLTRGKQLQDKTLADIAAQYGKTPAQVLLRWNLQLGTVPLPKANRREHLEQNIQIFDFGLSDDDMAKLNGLNEGYSSLGTLPYL